MIGKKKKKMTHTLRSSIISTHAKGVAAEPVLDRGRLERERGEKKKRRKGRVRPPYSFSIPIREEERNSIIALSPALSSHSTKRCSKPRRGKDRHRGPAFFREEKVPATRRFPRGEKRGGKRGGGGEDLASVICLDAVARIRLEEVGTAVQRWGERKEKGKKRALVAEVDTNWYFLSEGARSTGPRAGREGKWEGAGALDGWLIL